MAAVMMASGLAFTMFGSAHAQRAVYRTVSGHGHGYSHGCPCPTDCPPCDGEMADDGMGEVDTGDEMGEDLPEVADLTSDASFASASQSAAPNAIGDSLHAGYTFSGSYFFGYASPAGGRRYKVTNNNSALPQCRVFYNYNYFDAAFLLNDDEIDVHHHEFGAEWAFWCNMASVQVMVPMNYSFDSDITDFTNGIPTDTELGNVAVAVKAVMYQDCCKTISIGTGLDIPTAEDITFSDTAVFTFENEGFVLSPYVALLNNVSCNMFVQGFAQASIPLNGNGVSVDLAGLETGEITDSTLLYLDLSVGYWLNQDCCGNGVAAIVELHYTDTLDNDSVTLNGETLTSGDYELLNATIGAAVVHNCWSIRPAVSLPLLDDRAFDYELQLQVNRRF
jgi:hypothetical protein